MTISKKIIIFLFFVLIFFTFLVPVNDADTPWHLATGRYILANHEIPKADPFTFAEQKEAFFGRYILTQSWLAQTLLASVLDTAGVFGLILLKATIFTLIILFAWLVARKEGFYLVLVLLGAVFLGTIKPFISVRPQMFTFFFASLLLFLLDRFGRTGRKIYIMTVPLLMLLWTNMHGGVIFGVVVVFTFMLMALSPRFFHTSGPLQEEKNRKFILGVCLASLTFYLLNPNGYGAFPYALLTHATDYYSTLIEYSSPFSLMKKGALFLSPGGIPMSVVSIFYWSLVVVSLVMVWYFIRGRLWFPAVVLTFSCFLSLSAVRYIPLFGASFAMMLANVPFHKIEERLPARMRTVINVALMVLLSVMVFRFYPFNASGLHEFQESRRYAVRAGEFLRENHISGNIFVSYNKSGYILFSTQPESRIYVDARFVDPERTTKGMNISGYSITRPQYIFTIDRAINPAGGKLVIKPKDGGKGAAGFIEPEDRAGLLDDIHADIVVHDAVNAFEGYIFPLVLDLVRDDHWHLIHLDGNVMIFVREGEKFRRVIKEFEKDKKLIAEEIISEARQGAGAGKVEFLNSTATALLLERDTSERTRNVIQRALALEPGNNQSVYLMKLYDFLKLTAGVAETSSAR